MKSFPDNRILNTVKQHWNFSKEDVIIAVDEALDRGILSQEQIDDYLAYLPLEEEIQAKDKLIRKTKKNLFAIIFY